MLLRSHVLCTVGRCCHDSRFVSSGLFTAHCVLYHRSSVYTAFMYGSRSRVHCSCFSCNQLRNMGLWLCLQTNWLKHSEFTTARSPYTPLLATRKQSVLRMSADRDLVSERMEMERIAERKAAALKNKAEQAVKAKADKDRAERQKAEREKAEQDDVSKRKKRPRTPSRDPPPRQKLEAKAHSPPPHQPVIPPEQVIKSWDGSQHSVSPQGLMVFMNDDYLDEVVKGGDKAELSMLTRIMGVYWLCPGLICGRPVWKHEFTGKGLEGADPMMFWWSGSKQQGGWYLSTKCWQKDSEIEKVDVGMWCGVAEDRPTVAHYPYWAKKKNTSVHIVSYIDWLKGKHDELELEVHELKEKIAILEDAAIKGDKDPYHDDKDELRDDKAEHHDDKDEPGEDGPGDVGGTGIEDRQADLPNCLKGNRGRGGWMPRIAEFMVPWYKGNWTQCHQIVNWWYWSHPQLQKLVDPQLK